MRKAAFMSLGTVDLLLNLNSLLVQLVADFGTLLGTYDKGFAVIIEPWDGRLPHVPDPVLQLACLDASLAMKPVFDKFQARFITPLTPLIPPSCSCVAVQQPYQLGFGFSA